MDNDIPTSSGSKQQPDLKRPPGEYELWLSETGVVISRFSDFIRELAESDVDVEISENTINDARLKSFQNEYTTRFLNLITETELEYGYKSALDDFIRDRLEENSAVTNQWLNSIFNEHFNDIVITTGILRTIAHFDYAEANPAGPTMATAALTHENAEVRECGARAFESWVSLDSLKILKSINHPEKWLQDYINQVIADIEEEYK